MAIGFGAVAPEGLGAPRSSRIQPSKPGEAVVARTLKDFEGLEVPSEKFVVASQKFVKERPDAITEVGPGVFRFALRIRAGEWWDGDRGTGSKDRQRAEVKGLGPNPRSGETAEYTMTWRSSEGNLSSGRFCHIYQLKATNGDKGAPLIVMSVLSGNRAAVRYCSGKQSGFTTAREFSFTPGKWTTVKIRFKTSTGNSDKVANGELMVSVNGDEFQGKKGIALYRPDAEEYRSKWGLYRGVDAKSRLSDGWVEHKDVTARVLGK